MKNLKMFLHLAIKVSPSYIILVISQAIVTSGRLFANVILPKYLIDELIGAKDSNMLLLYGGAIVCSNLLFGLLEKTLKRAIDIKAQYVKDMMNRAMAQKIMAVEYSYLENPYYLDLKERAVFAITNQSVLEQMIVSLASVLNGIVTITGLLVIISTLNVLLLLALLVTVAASVGLLLGFNKFLRDMFQNIIPVNRKYGYYIDLVFETALQKDVRIYDMKDLLTDQITNINVDVNRWFAKFHHKEGFLRGGLSILSDLQATIAYGYVGLRVLSSKFGPKIGIGSFTMYVSAVINFTSTIGTLLEKIVNVVQLIGYLDPFVEFMELPDAKEETGMVPFEGSIEEVKFEDVSFAYPGSEKLVLEHVSFEFHKGQKISIVGLNGAGKTTLIKLIARLYHPTSGTIYINGRDIFEYDYKTYMARIAAVFQDFKLFDFTIRENVSCNKNGDTAKIDHIIRQVGLEKKVDELADGIDTIFGKEYDERGIDMSGGQKQKVAIARALYKEASLIILDEPTSALDPLAEADIYNNFNELVQDKTAIYISHRMSSSVFCDKILILDGGTVSDFDSHEHLMQKKDSLYYKLFMSQAENYQLEA
ncbi:ABC transporter, ATP-binding protein [Lachnospiraceae bacterium KM106-2]|nr:ABC transporter, ATP-binding protein [Lachnospiraceae bacterium KM106-2]